MRRAAGAGEGEGEGEGWFAFGLRACRPPAAGPHRARVVEWSLAAGAAQRAERKGECRSEMRESVAEPD